MDGAPAAREDLQQPSLKGYEARWIIGKHEVVANEEETPCNASGAFIVGWSIARDVGEHILTRDSIVERAKCTLKTVCDHKQLNETGVLAHVMDDTAPSQVTLLK